MSLPHLTLGLTDLNLPDSDDCIVNEKITDKQVKEAYLQKVHEFPPEQYPQKFRKIREAYELLKSEKARLAYTLFYTEELETNEILSSIFIDQKRSVPDEKQFLAALKESLKS